MAHGFHDFARQIAPACTRRNPRPRTTDAHADKVAPVVHTSSTRTTHRRSSSRRLPRRRRSRCQWTEIVIASSILRRPARSHATWGGLQRLRNHGREETPMHRATALASTPA